MDEYAGDVMKRKSEKDLQPIIRMIEAELKKFFEIEDRVGLAIALTLPPDYSRASWITNLSRDDGIKLFINTAHAMSNEMN